MKNLNKLILCVAFFILIAAFPQFSEASSTSYHITNFGDYDIYTNATSYCPYAGTYDILSKLPYNAKVTRIVGTFQYTDMHYYGTFDSFVSITDRYNNSAVLYNSGSVWYTDYEGKTVPFDVNVNAYGLSKLNYSSYAGGYGGHASYIHITDVYYEIYNWDTFDFSITPEKFVKVTTSKSYYYPLKMKVVNVQSGAENTITYDGYTGSVVLSSNLIVGNTYTFKLYEQGGQDTWHEIYSKNILIPSDTYEAMVAAQAARTAAEAALAEVKKLGSQLQHDIIWDFNTSGNVSPWTQTNNLSSITATNSCLEATVSGGNDPLICTTPGLGLSADSYTKVKIKMKNNTSATTGSFYWVTNADGTWEGTKKTISFPIKANDTGYSIYTVDVSSNAYWREVINQLRFDPEGTSSGTISIDYIKMCKTDATYDAANASIPVFTVISDKAFVRAIHGEFSGNNSNVTATAGSGYTVLTGTLTVSSGKTQEIQAAKINGNTLVFNVIAQPSLDDIATVSFE